MVTVSEGVKAMGTTRSFRTGVPAEPSLGPVWGGGLAYPSSLARKRRAEVGSNAVRF